MIVISLILAIIAAVLVGGLLLLADQIGFYLIILFPIVAGVAIGFAAAVPFLGRASSRSENPTNPSLSGLADVVVRDTRPSRLPLIIVCLIGTAIATVVYWGGAYVLTINEIYQSDRAEVVAQSPGMTAAEADELIDEYLVEETGSSGLLGYIKLLQEDLSFPVFVEILAEEGVTINRAASSSGGINLQGTLAYIYWGVEILLIFGLACSTALGRARGETPPAETAAATAG